MPIIDLPQGRVQYRLAGPGDSAHPPVVLLYGLLVNCERWTEVADDLAARGIRSYALDLPLGSHSLALRPDADLTPRGVARLIIAFLETLGLTNVTLVGNDTGTALCQFVIDIDDTRIARLVLTDGDAFDQFPPRSLRPVFKLGRRPAGVHALMSMMRPTWIRDRVHGQNVSKPLEAALTRRWIAPALADRAVRRDTAKFLRGVDPAELLDVSTRLGRFTNPVVMLWGGADRFFTIDLAHRLCEAFPNAQLVEIPDGRTFIPLDQPQRVANEIQSVLECR
ncbi:MAG: alpha/beta fold hydrolase [Mycobacterium sp.]|uniref:alpha/beta fold hydrolase n=1 Tax=Mycobacterium sp. TaxID=1785 RepID=UPI003F9509ED